MKKTLTLLALLGMLAAYPLTAEEHWMVGVTCHDNNESSEYYRDNYPKVVDAGAYTFSKSDADSYATNQCWAAAAADTLAWWEDRVEENGALILHDTPRGLQLWKTLSPMFVKDGGYPRYAMNYWLWGELPSYAQSFLSSTWTSEHQDFHGYFHHLKGQMEEYTTEYIMIINHSMTYTVRVSDDPDCIAEAHARYLEKEEKLLSLVEEGWGLNFTTVNHAMAAYGFETDEDGHLTKMWYTDNNPGGVRDGFLKATRLNEELWDNGNTQKKQLQTYTGYGDFRSFNAIRTRGIQFDTYELTFDGVDDEPLFSHYLNVTYDGGEHELQYDLRNAKDDESPVTAKNEAGERISTGDITLKKGKLSLVEGVGEYDGGGKTSGTITFEGTAGTERTLSVQHSDTIAAGIVIAAAEGNTLDVAAGVTASFGTLSGKGNLDKTGLGTAEVTGDVTLEGDIRVHEGSFIFGKDATISETTALTVDAGAHVQGSESKSLTLTIASGVHENNGVMTLATTVKNGAVLKGGGTFADVAVEEGGTLIVGNSPGRQTYTGNLSVNLGDIVFSVDGWETPADGENCGWASNTYSNIVMNGGSLTLGNGSTLEFALGGGAMAALLDDSGTEFSMTIATGFGNGNEFTTEFLKQLAQQTIFTYSTEEGAFTGSHPQLQDGETLNTHITNLEYKLLDDSRLCVTGVYWAAEPMVPEPTTGTLSLLALAGLCARRRRK
ncbi:MAG: hypothetical protein Q4C88_07405 [Akkermansia sp.]|nr:hypothetical protein [Akkermansia sp.]